jgi:methylase of polypeptide subunit release factors
VKGFRLAAPEEVLKQKTYGRINVFYSDSLEGGGTLPWGQSVVDLVRDRIGPVDRAFEWCAGPGFIGFSLLSEGLCGSLTLADINPSAIEVAQATIEHNGLSGTVDTYVSDCFDSVPSAEKWDLVVGNPPHADSSEILFPKPAVIYQDLGWRSHRKFYEQVGEHLTENGSIVILEKGAFSKPETFRPMIDSSPLLTWVDAVPTVEGFYLIWAKRS